MLILLIISYIVSIFTSYFLMRFVYKNMKNAEFLPHSFIIFLLFVPIINLGVILIMSIEALLTKFPNKTFYKSFFKL